MHRLGPALLAALAWSCAGAADDAGAVEEVDGSGAAAALRIELVSCDVTRRGLFGDPPFALATLRATNRSDRTLRIWGFLGEVPETRAQRRVDGAWRELEVPPCDIDPDVGALAPGAAVEVEAYLDPAEGEFRVAVGYWEAGAAEDPTGAASRADVPPRDAWIWEWSAPFRPE